MADTAKDPTDRLLAVGVTYRSAGAALRDRLFAEDPDPSGLLARLGEMHMSESMVLATCERIEVFAVDDDPGSRARALLDLIADEARIPGAEIKGQSVRFQGTEAIRHVFAVTASLDSQVVGEPQILGQVKDGHRRAEEAGLMGPSLDSVLRAAYAAAKMVRSGTAIAEQPVSIAAAAVQVARNVHGDLGRRRGLLIGLGEMGEYMASELRDAGLRNLVIVHGSPARAEAAARRLGCHYRPWEALADALAGADIVVASAGTGQFTVTRAMVEAALKQRRREPIFLIDTAVPGDVEPAAAEPDGAFVYDLEDLERVALKGKATREAQTAAAWRILDEELAGFLRRCAERGAAPAVTALRDHFESVRDQVLAEGATDAEAATRLMVKRLLHDPSEVLREAAAGPAKRKRGGLGGLEDAARRLFRLGPGTAGSEPAEPGGPENRDAGKEKDE